MSDPISIKPLSGFTPVEPERRPAAAFPEPASHRVTSPGHPSPTLRLEPGLGLVVIEFLDESGKVQSSLPSQRQLDAYRSHAESVPSDKPHPTPTHPPEPPPRTEPAKPPTNETA